MHGRLARGEWGLGACFRLGAYSGKKIQPRRLAVALCVESFLYTLAGGGSGLLLAVAAAYAVRDAFYESVSNRVALGEVAADRLPISALLSRGGKGCCSA